MPEPADTPGPDLIDTHCHLTYEGLGDQVDAVLDRARRAGVRRCITVGTDVADSRAVLDVSGRHDNVWAVVGVHAHEAGKTSSETWSDLASLLEPAGTAPRPVAVGETGLDYHYDFSDRPSQRDGFVEQIALAERCDLPLVIHCREAVDDALLILDDHRTRDARGVFHCFTGTPDEAATIVQAGWYLSLSGIVTFKNAAELRDAARLVPLDRLLLETDAPFCSPEPIRHVRPNEPAHVVHTCRYLAEVLDVDVDELARQCNANAERLFGLTPAREEG